MGRGKSKAKQTKVARELKYGSGSSDLSALEAELRGESASEEFSEDESSEDKN
jgi:hypothetical protein